MPIIKDAEVRPIGIVCTRGQRPKRCAYCGRDGGRLCDFEVSPGKTCDVPMCHVCTYSPRVEKDYCRDHRPAAEVRS